MSINNTYLIGLKCLEKNNLSSNSNIVCHSQIPFERILLLVRDTYHQICFPSLIRCTFLPHDLIELRGVEFSKYIYFNK